MVVRVQCLSGAVRSMLKMAVCLVVAAVTVMALSGLAGTTAEAQTHPASSCQPDTLGNDPCDGATGPIGENSCNGGDACRNAAGPVGAGSCVGSRSCDVTVGSIGAGSCIGNEACNAAGGDVGDGSCLGDFACYATGGAVGAGSCVGNYACPGSSGPIGDCEFNSVDADCDGVASGVDCDDTDASVIIRCAPAAAYAGPFTVSPEPVGGPSGLGTDPSPAATEPAAEPAAEPVPAAGLAFTGATSTTLTFVALGLIGAGAMLAPASRRRQ